jgi:acetylornithine deacetylase/succinyl-diaminopimelate desuccinylase-like protein
VIKEHGASDGRYFSAKWMPVILHRPTCENIHSKNEWVDVDAVAWVYEVYREFILGT